jgi:hypothetical protein
MKINRMMLHWMLDGMVELVWQNEELDSASLEEFQFWTEALEEYLVKLKDANGAHILDLRVVLEGL